VAMCAKSHHNIVYFRNFDLALNLVIARRIGDRRGNAAIKSNADSSPLELCRGGAG
jgi:hypothetical protein